MIICSDEKTIKMEIKIKTGGQLESLQRGPKKLETIKINVIGNGGYGYELWLNDSSLSYLDTQEMLAIRDAINNALVEGLKLNTER